MDANIINIEPLSLGAFLSLMLGVLFTVAKLILPSLIKKINKKLENDGDSEEIKTHPTQPTKTTDENMKTFLQDTAKEYYGTIKDLADQRQGALEKLQREYEVKLAENAELKVTNKLQEDIIKDYRQKYTDERVKNEKAENYIDKLEKVNDELELKLREYIVRLEKNNLITKEEIKNLGVRDTEELMQFVENQNKGAE